MVSGRLAFCALLGGACFWQPLAAPSLADDFERIKHELPELNFLEAQALFANAKRTGRVATTQSKIEHLVVLFVENRAADHIFGCMMGDKEDFDGIPTRPDGGHWKLFPAKTGSGADVKPGDKTVNVSCGTAKYVCSGHGYTHEMFSASQLPIKHTLAENFAVFNKMFTSVPGPSWPNHIFAQSATSCGVSSNVMYNKCGGPYAQFPQMTIYDSLSMANVPFAMFVNDTCGANTSQSCGSVSPGWGKNTGTNSSTGLDPDVTLAGVARHKKRIFSHTLFYEQAAAGTLPAFSWISPKHEAADHPCMDIAKGERLLKDVYEALRDGPGWEKTLFIITYDDYGGFYDHVVPPAAVNDESPCNVWNKQHNISKDAPTVCPTAFDFKKTGLRSSTMLISPWIKKGSIINEPKSRADGSKVDGDPPPQWDHTSILASAKKLFNLPNFLTKRDAWAGSFDELLLDKVRPAEDSPLHLPDAPKPASPWGPPHEQVIDFDDFGDDERKGKVADTATPQHCSAELLHAGKDSCLGPDAVTQKQRKLIELYGALTQTPLPDIESMNFKQADAWTKARWAEYMAMHQEGASAPSQLI